MTRIGYLFLRASTSPRECAPDVSSPARASAPNESRRLLVSCTRRRQRSGWSDAHAESSAADDRRSHPRHHQRRRSSPRGPRHACICGEGSSRDRLSPARRDCRTVGAQEMRSRPMAAGECFRTVGRRGLECRLIVMTRSSGLITGIMVPRRSTRIARRKNLPRAPARLGQYRAVCAPTRSRAEDSASYAATRRRSSARSSTSVPSTIRSSAAAMCPRRAGEEREALGGGIEVSATRRDRDTPAARQANSPARTDR